MHLPDLLEAAMLLCFGIAWPVANLRMLRTGKADGKGTAFTTIILAGYVAGALAKVALTWSGAGLAPVFWLYVLNAVSVGTNLALQRQLRPGTPRAPLVKALRRLVAVRVRAA